MTEKTRIRRRQYRLEHGEEVRAKERLRYKENPLRWKAYELKSKYGLTLVQFSEILARQNGRCAICGTREPGGRGTWKVDHNHATGRVRGLLCNSHNRALGLFNDSPAHLRKAAEYLERQE